MTRLSLEPGDEAVQFSILGPVRVWRSGKELHLGPKQQRLILAVLLARAGRPVSMHEFTDLLWDGEPPLSAANAVHRYVGTLRRLLEPDLPARSPGRWLARQAGGTSCTSTLAPSTCWVSERWWSGPDGQRRPETPRQPWAFSLRP